MIWYFLTLGVSTLVVVCVAIAAYVHLRRRLQAAHAIPEESNGEIEHEHQSEKIER
jgi:hypothetical protein